MRKALQFIQQAERIETHAVLSRNQMLRQLRLEKEQLLSGQKAFKQRILCPLAVAQEDFMHFRAPLVIGNIIGDDIAGGLTACPGLASHPSFSLSFPI